MWTALIDRVVGFKGTAVLLAFAALLAFAGWKTLAADRLELKLEAATARQHELEARIETQNEGMRLVQRAAAAKAQLSQRAAVAAQRALSAAEARAARIEAAPAPKSCQDALRFLADDAASEGGL